MDGTGTGTGKIHPAGGSRETIRTGGAVARLDDLPHSLQRIRDHSMQLFTTQAASE